MAKDLWDLPLSTESPRAAEQYVLAVEKLLSANVGAEEALGRAIDADPGFALAHAARARVLQLRGAMPEARAAAARAVLLAPSATRRERGHVEALALNLEPDMPRTLAHVLEHLREFPRDGLVLSLTSGIFGLIGFSGRRDRNESLLDLLDGLAVSYGEDWWFLNVHGFACTEADKRTRGRRLVDRALALNPRNAHAAHARAHVCYEANDMRGGGGLPAVLAARLRSDGAAALPPLLAPGALRARPRPPGVRLDALRRAHPAGELLRPGPHHAVRLGVAALALPSLGQGARGRGLGRAAGLRAPVLSHAERGLRRRACGDGVRGLRRSRGRRREDRGAAPGRAGGATAGGARRRGRGRGHGGLRAGRRRRR